MEAKPVAIWLFLCSLMVICMVGIGGFTRLSKAGLSITEWKPITGTLLPLSEQDWLKEKSKYEATPEYKAFNYGMSMEEFRTIYLIEYVHRLIARLTGLVFILPFIYFTLKKRIPKNAVIRLSTALLFGILQAFAGWYMVKSGLVVNPHVSHYKLALHLLLALVIFALLSYQFFDYQIKPKQIIKINSNITCYIWIILILVTIQIIFGAFVAGLNAGLIYNTFPLMDGQIVPEDLFYLQPAWLNIFENRATVQFVHRVLALLILVLVAILTIKNASVKPVYIMLLSVIVQVILGVVTLLLHIPMAIAIAHQMFSFILFGSGLYCLCYLRNQI
ncbi:MULTISPECIES: COX15/CtaA family protein [Wolbachia]|uniref:COX15/CtaA family protein n=1 Tax=Wolbachia TaxID=953 RepID=UPI0002404467|nr:MULTISPECIES: COX15/CtaA family protein [Wolbachia]UYC23227.1 COX15/CtaA family protein [Wolbachia endosymbiont of Aedes aegypti]QBB83512.1 heme A synthase [Wolbachia pipientis wAlbB]QDW08320.1 heme A synthase [Wolbachia pipientis]QZA83706.1 COX15/CtaA family protein [Wolbachia pipientis]THA19930.1 heme A synthase [Wolbachia endosymbiont of Aedes albopictus]